MEIKLKDRIEADVVYEFLRALGVEDVHTVRSVQIEPDRVMVRVSHNQLNEDGGLLVSEHGMRIDYGQPVDRPFQSPVLNEIYADAK